ncbi:MAG: hypothetical protein ABEJ31_12080, partial [Haloarculaceae archaeon]
MSHDSAALEHDRAPTLAAVRAHLATHGTRDASLLAAALTGALALVRLVHNAPLRSPAPVGGLVGPLSVAAAGVAGGATGAPDAGD